MTKPRRGRRICKNCGRKYYAPGSGNYVVNNCSHCTMRFSDEEAEMMLKKLGYGGGQNRTSRNNG